jgi:nicotinamidase-related amidase
MGMATSMSANQHDTAILCMDYQNDFVGSYAADRQRELLSKTSAVTPRRSLLDHRSGNGAQVSRHYAFGADGIATSGVVLSTVRWAADADYEITVLSDCCANADEEVHRVLTQKIFPRQATVVAPADWLQALS